MDEATPKPTCRTCIFHEQNVQMRRCFRFPPVIMWADDTFRTVYPYTNLHEWCGEHKEAQPAAPPPTTPAGG
jgi:hypothetical protein